MRPPVKRAALPEAVTAAYAAVFFGSPLVSLVAPPFSHGWAGGVILVYLILAGLLRRIR